MRAWEAAGLALLIVLVPAITWANPGPAYDPKNMPIVVFGELVPVMLETMIIRRWFELKFLEAFLTAALANIVSFCVPMFVLRGAFFFPHEMLDRLNDLYVIKWQSVLAGVTPVGDAVLLGDVATDLVFSLGFLLAIAILLELPVYFLALRRNVKSIEAALVANLVSYPVYYSLVLLGVLIVNRLEP